MSESSAKNDEESIEASSPIEKVRKTIIPEFNIIPCTPERIVECNGLYDYKKEAEAKATALLITPQPSELVEEILKNYRDQVDLNEFHYTTPERPKILDSDEE